MLNFGHCTLRKVRPSRESLEDGMKNDQRSRKIKD